MEYWELKDKWIEYCKVTKNPYSYNKYAEMYPNIRVKRNLNFKNLSKEDKNKYLAEKKAEHKLKWSIQERINQKRKELWIVI